MEKLQKASVPAAADVYPGNVHAFDMLTPWEPNSAAAKKRLEQVYADWLAGRF